MKYSVRITDDWLPLPDQILGALQWREGDTLELEIVGDVLLVRLLETAVRAPESDRKAPLKGRK